MNKTLLALSVSLVPMVGIAAPNDTPGAPDYSYVQGDWIVDGDAHGTGHDYDGYGIEGSVAITPNVYVNGRYDWVDVDSSAFDANRTSIGVGANDFYDFGRGDGTGVGYYGQVSFERLNLDDLPGSNDDADANGYGADVGLRWMVDPRIEINPHVGWVDYGDLGSGLGDADGVRYGVRALGYVNDALALTADFRASDIETSRRDIGFDNEIRVGARVNF
ncbi:porin family outer membrane protein [Salinisphaera sp. T5B8]|uniref:outer membrane beta-barrel protein n=1 Tax=unclassified Salinisphaera TaxID=2649847 RepID=UPI00333FAA85